MDYIYLLNSNNPDKELEYFWLTFKDSIKCYLNKSEIEEINELSDKLNNLQHNQKYTDIKKYIQSHIEKIGYNMIKKDDCYKIGHLITNIKRWKNITGNNICGDDNVFFGLIRIYIKLYKKIYLSDKNYHETIYNCIKNYSNDTTKHIELIHIMNISIDNKIYGNIDILKHILDMNAFIDLNKKNEISTKFIINTKGIKLCKYLKKTNV